ncbi:cobalamin-independent methionine synthase II family protein [Flavilitoribacter nigricans]|uniref:Methionine synthase n=1 Tax=Flavilitoribacter nigricans (strain ATCC 23147 / DSM 23189 / NBRC 102662 / NCIMB 1420 / SS-2) TaxID=1122177 RepID=A0A2D0NH76_FLAN2|nr:cobalamin-independent methionine synthase II family protein [Flavilitoribacter nigricans]PHN07845.1 methionine synthase [Flavilitoribacter nigricans DSM 23189 = NBRC 102662]
MTDHPIRTTVIGSYPFPGWLEFAARHLDQFGAADVEEMIDDAVVAAVHDQVTAGLDVITDGEQTRLDFNLSFYGYIAGIERETVSPRLWGPPAHDQRGKHRIVESLRAPNGLGVVEEYRRLQRLAPDGPVLKASVPGPFTLSGRLLPNKEYPDRYAITEALLPIVRNELKALIAVGCREITVDEPSMSCYAYKEDTRRFVDIFNRTIEPVVGKCRLSTHLCFGNYKGHAVGYRRIAPMLPDFLDFKVDEVHLEMANREFAELELIEKFAERMEVAVGVIDVKSYYIETPEDVAARIRQCLQYVPADKLSVAPDCGLSQTARWAAKKKLNSMVAGAALVRAEL